MSSFDNNNIILSIPKKIGLGISSILVPCICAAISVFFITNSNILILGHFGTFARFARYSMPLLFVIVGAYASFTLDPSNKHWISKIIHIALSVICLAAIVSLFIYNYATPFTEVVSIELWLLFLYGVCLYFLFKLEEEDKK